MKKTVLFTKIFVVTLSLGLMWGCQSTAVGPSTASQKENLLVRSGFRAKTVTTPKQQQRVSALPAGKVSTVTYGGKLYYVYPTATKDRILVGNQAQYNAYKQAIVAYGLTQAPILWRKRTDPIAFSFSNSMGSVRSGIDWGILEERRLAAR